MGYAGPVYGTPATLDMTGLILRDSAVETVTHPLRSGYTATRDPVYVLGSAGRGLVGKRLGLALAGHPSRQNRRR